jgi:hypothetical protein
MNRWLIYSLLCVIALTVILLSVASAQVKVRTIPQIQQVLLDSLKKLDTLQAAAAGKFLDKSPNWNGADANADTVQITGVVLVKPGVLTYTLTRYNIYIQDTTSGQLWAGLNVLTNDTSAQAQLSGINALDTGMVVTITGRILEYGSQNNSLTEMYHYSVSAPAYTTPPPISIWGNIPRPAPKEISVADLANGNLPHPSTAEKYESMYVIVRNVTVTQVDYSSGYFWFQDSLGNQARDYDGSQWFTLRGHKNSSSRYSPPPVGTKLSYIRGIVLPQSRTGTCGDYAIMPMYPGPRELSSSKYPGDIVIAAFAPQISSIARTPTPPKATDAVTVTWKAKNLNAGRIDSSFFNWKFGSNTKTPWTRTKVTPTSGDSLYSATISPTNGDSLICYFVEAYGGGIYGASPDPSVPNFYQVRQTGLTINDVQYTPFVNGFSGFVGDTVTVSGTVFCDSTDNKENITRPRIWIAAKAGAWNSIVTYGVDASVGMDALVRGDSIQITGVVSETNSRTDIKVTKPVTLIKHGATVVAPTAINMGSPDYTDYMLSNMPVDGNPTFEKWESTLIQANNVYLVLRNADNPSGGASSNFGEFFASPNVLGTSPITQYGIRVNDNGTNHFYADTSVGYLGTGGRFRVDHPISPDKTTLIPLGAKISFIAGILDYSFGEYKIEPRKDNDFGVVTSVTYQVAGVVPTSFELSQNYPNPFNPSTTIRYMMPTGGKVTLRVYNLLGQVVETLVEQHQNAGAYVVVFDASRLSSGTYFYRLDTDQYSVTKKMMLLK